MKSFEKPPIDYLSKEREEASETEIKKEDLPQFQIEIPPREAPDKNCFQASLGMILEGWEEKKAPDLEILNQISHHEKGRGTWPGWAIVWLKQRGYGVEIYSNFDIEKFANLGEQYLESEEYAKKHELDKERKWKDYLRYLDIQKGAESARAIIENNIQINKDTGLAELKEIFEKVKNGARAIFLIDGDHYVPITGFDGENVIYNNASEKGVEVNKKKELKRFIEKWNRFNIRGVILISKPERE